MKFRIRYEQGGEHRTAEVEANSPDEAVVKFRHVRPSQPHWPGKPQHRVVSVCSDEVDEEPGW